MSESRFQALTAEIVRFMRGKYRLYEVPGRYRGVDFLMFRQGKKNVVTIIPHEDFYEFSIVYGRAEREVFEQHRDEFPEHIRDIYYNSRTYPDGKWMLFRVESPEEFEVIKKLILIKKKPNRKPLPKENAVYGKCGHRCDMCVHYTKSGFSDEFRAGLEERLTRVYNHSDWSMRCTAAKRRDAYGLLRSVECAKEKGCERCTASKSIPAPKQQSDMRSLSRYISKRTM